MPDFDTPDFNAPDLSTADFSAPDPSATDASVPDATPAFDLPGLDTGTPDATPDTAAIDDGAAATDIAAADPDPYATDSGQWDQETRNYAALGDLHNMIDDHVNTYGGFPDDGALDQFHDSIIDHWGAPPEQAANDNGAAPSGDALSQTPDESAPDMETSGDQSAAAGADGETVPAPSVDSAKQTTTVDTAGLTSDIIRSLNTQQIAAISKRQISGSGNQPAAASRDFDDGKTDTSQDKPWLDRTNPEFRQKIAEAEKSADKLNNGYGAKNEKSTALGRYQILKGPLEDAGWKDAQGNWTKEANDQGVHTDEGFRNNVQAQENAMDDVMRRNEEQLKGKGATGFVGQTLTGIDGKPVPITEAGLAAAAHRAGAGATNKYVNDRATGVPYPSEKNAYDTAQFIETRLRNFSSTPYTWGQN